MNEQEFELKRKQLVEYMKSLGVIESKEIEKAFLKIKREIFFPSNIKQFAYADEAFPIGFNQTISQPSTIAIMLELLEPGPGMKILEVGSGCGYVLALLSQIVEKKGKVFGVELLKELVEQSKENLKLHGIKNVKVFQGDGAHGLKEFAPFDRILISAACPFIPKPLFDQVIEKGLIVAPVGDSFTQEMLVMKKINGKPVKKPYLKTLFRFVPLKSKYFNQEGF
jgi:protein-L-isoaspartate(D-aspartate) O-methyltransferase